MITEFQLKQALPFATEANIKKYLTPLNLTCEKYSINTPKRISAFLAQIAHESGSLRYVRELASGDAYDTRTDLGNTPEIDGDGAKYKGRGLIQVTGKANYKALSVALNFDFVNEPEKLELPGAATMSAGWFWNLRGLNALADVDDFRKITKRINGGYNGWDDRVKHWGRCRLAFGIKEVLIT